MPVLMLTWIVAAAAPSADLAPWFAEAWSARPEVERARAQLESARAARAAAGVWLENPQVQAGVSSDALFGAEGELDVDLQVSQELRWPGTRLSLQRAGDASIAQARAQLSRARLDVAADVEEAYAGVVAARLTRDVWLEVARIARALDDVAKRKAEAGATGSLEAALASADAASAEAQAIGARAAVVDAEARWCAALGRSPCAPEDGQADAGGLARWPALVALDEARAASAAAQLDRRLDVEAARHAQRAAQEQADAAALAWLPTAKLALGYSFERGVVDVPGAAAPAIDADQLLAAQLSVTLPAWNWRRDEVHAARAAAHTAEAQSRAAAIASASAVRSAGAAFDAADESARRLADVQPRVTAALADLERAVSAGVLTLDDALTTRDRLLQARLGAVEAERRRVVAHAALLRALAQPLVPGAEDGAEDGAKDPEGTEP